MSAVGSVRPPDLARSTATMTGLTLLSRVTGFVRNVVVVAVLGDTFLGNVYQSANQVPNLLFELLAAGVLQAVLIPTLVELAGRGRDDEAEHVARSVLGLAGALLAGLALVGVLLAPAIMRLLVSGVDDPQVRDDQVRLGTILLWFFLPQVVLYASNMVATGVLNAKGHFATPAFAPLLNNVVVTASYGLFAWMRHGAEPSLELTGAQTAVLGLGTTLGVVAFCTAPVVAAVRSGTSLRPRFDWRHPMVRRIARLGGWAAVYLAATNVLLGVVIVLLNHVRGGVVLWSLAFTIFLLPHALVSLPVLTTAFPNMSRHAASGDGAAYQRTVAAGLRAIAYLVLPAAAGMVALGLPLARLLRFGDFSAEGVLTVAAAVAALGPGLVGYGTYLFLTRALYATGDTRTPATVNVVLVAVAATAMALSFTVVDGDDRVWALAAVHSAAYLVGSVVLFAFVRGRAGGAPSSDLARSLAASLGGAAAGAAVMWAVAEQVGGSGRPGALVALVAAGAAGLLVYVGVAAGLGGPRPSTIPVLLRGEHG